METRWQCGASHPAIAMQSRGGREGKVCFVRLLFTEMKLWAFFSPFNRHVKPTEKWKPIWCVGIACMQHIQHVIWIRFEYFRHFKSEYYQLPYIKRLWVNKWGWGWIFNWWTCHKTKTISAPFVRPLSKSIRWIYVLTHLQKIDVSMCKPWYSSRPFPLSFLRPPEPLHCVQRAIRVPEITVPLAKWCNYTETAKIGPCFSCCFKFRSRREERATGGAFRRQSCSRVKEGGWRVCFAVLHVQSSLYSAFTCWNPFRAAVRGQFWPVQYGYYMRSVLEQRCGAGVPLCCGLCL